MATIVRGPRAADHFTIISNHALRDERLSWKARGLLAYLMSMDTGWVTTIERMSKVAPDGAASVKSGLSELERFGYLERRQARSNGDQAGKFSNTEYHVSDDPTDPEVSELTVSRFSASGLTDSGESGTKKTSSKKTSPKKTSKTRGSGSVVVEPSVTRAPANTATTPTQKLTAAGVADRDRGRFREWLRTVKGARNANGVIMASSPDDLTDQVREWRASLDIKAEPDAEPVLCDHGHDIALGAHMCPTCDPARQRTHNPAPKPPTARPDWLSDLLATGEHDELAALMNGTSA